MQKRLHEEQIFSQYIEIGWGGDKQYSCIDRTCLVHVIMFISKNLVNISDKQVKEYTGLKAEFKKISLFVLGFFVFLFVRVFYFINFAFFLEGEGVIVYLLEGVL